LKLKTKIYYLADKKTGTIIHSHAANFYDALNPENPDESRMNLSEEEVWNHFARHRDFDAVKKIHAIKKREDCHYQEMNPRDEDVQRGAFHKFKFEKGKFTKRSEEELREEAAYEEKRSYILRILNQDLIVEKAKASPDTKLLSAIESKIAKVKNLPRAALKDKGIEDF